MNTGTNSLKAAIKSLQIITKKQDLLLFGHCRITDFNVAQHQMCKEDKFVNRMRCTRIRHNDTVQMCVLKNVKGFLMTHAQLFVVCF